MAKNKGQKVLEQVKEALARHTVLGLDVEGMDEEGQSYLKNAGFRWEENAFLQSHYDCDGSTVHDMRVAFYTGEVWMNGIRIDDDFEARMALISALYWDPRFVVAHIQNPKLTPNQERQILRGTVNEVEMGSLKHALQELNQKDHTQLVQYADQLLAEAPKGSIHKALSALCGITDQLKADELRDRIKELIVPDFAVELLLDERMLPVTVSWPAGFMVLEMRDQPIRVHFSYT